MHPSVEKAKAEVRKMLVIAVFFAIGFCIIILHNRLLVEGSKIQIASYVSALVGGLIAAKVSLTVDHLPFFDAFPHKPMIYNIGWKTSLYAVGAMGFLYTEPFVKHLVKGAGLYVSHRQAWHELTTAPYLGNHDLGCGASARVRDDAGDQSLARKRPVDIHVFGRQTHAGCGSTPAQGRVKPQTPPP